MSLAQIRDEYRVPARLGARVTVAPLDLEGVVTGCMEHRGTSYVEVDTEDLVINIHPEDLTWSTP